MVLVPDGITVIWQLSQLIAVRAFKIDREAVTNRQYLQYLVQTHQPIDEQYWEIRGIFSKTIKPRYAEFDDPVKNVTWDEAWKYARRRGARLPRCVEWIRAIKGPRPDGWPGGGEGDIDRYFEDFARTRFGPDLADVFPRHAAPFDTGEHLNPAVTFARQWEWATEPLFALRDIHEDRGFAAMRAADVEQAHKNNRPEDVPLIYAHWERVRAGPRMTSVPDWESSDERPLLGFVPDQARYENGMISSLSRSLGGGKIGFRCAANA
jgi:hypothetical protein